MKSNKLALIALLVWLATVAVFAWFFIRGNTVAGNDGRTAVVLQAGERDLILSEMRGMLAATQGILDGANNGDMQHISQAARAAGMAVTVDASPVLMAKLPLELKRLGMSVHRDMDDIADAAEKGRPPAEILKMTSGVLAKCVACHATWQLRLANQGSQ
jgi:hypothetical protein